MSRQIPCAFEQCVEIWKFEARLFGGTSHPNTRSVPPSPHTNTAHAFTVQVNSASHTAHTCPVSELCVSVHLVQSEQMHSVKCSVVPGKASRRLIRGVYPGLRYILRSAVYAGFAGKQGISTHRHCASEQLHARSLYLRTCSLPAHTVASPGKAPMRLIRGRGFWER